MSTGKNVIRTSTVAKNQNPTKQKDAPKKALAVKKSSSKGKQMNKKTVSGTSEGTGTITTPQMSPSNSSETLSLSDKSKYVTVKDGQLLNTNDNQIQMVVAVKEPGYSAVKR
jgi:hypothetical protein